MKKKSDQLVIQNNDATAVDAVTTSFLMLGAARYANHAHQSAKSDLVRFCQAVRDDRRYQHFGFSSMDEFLDSPMSPFKRDTFYREEKLYLAEGVEQYDLFNELKIPATLRRRLSSGDIAIDGDEVVVAGSERVSLTNGGSIKTIVEQLVRDKIAAEGQISKSDKEIARLERIADEHKKLKAELAELDEKPAYVVAYLRAVEAFLVFIAEVKDLPGDLKAERAEGDLDHISELLEQLYRAYGESFPFRTQRRAA
ncbi:MAG TPA: hypothetical protein PLR83_00260 [Pyrinomonadaceae bacterium]|nr:hypothetical protein [Pyrinomonadaceae bacterium]